MAEILNQDEIDALLDIAEEGGDVNEASDITFKKQLNFSTYDFKKPSKISAEEFRAFRTLHETLLRDLITDVSTQLRKIVDIHLHSIEQMTYGEFMLSIPEQTSLNTLLLRPLNGRMVQECNPNIAFYIINELMGGSRIGLEENMTRELTEIEVSVLEHFYDTINSHLRQAWRKASPIEFKLETSDTNIHNTQIVPNHEIVLLVVYEFTMDEQKGFINLCYPVNYIEPALTNLLKKMLEDSEDKRASRNRDIRTLLSGAKMNLDAILAESEFSVEDILNLSEGDTILFNKLATNQTTKLFINKKEKYLANSGISNSHKAVEITQNFQIERRKTVERLRSIKEERKKIAMEKKAMIDKIAGNV